jgi:hypothetical protein
MKRMKKMILAGAALLALASCQESLDEKAAKEAKMYTKKNCPAQMGDNLRMDSLTFEADTHTLHYYYTLMGQADGPGQLNQELARSSLLTELKNTTSMMSFKEAGYQFAYTYHSQRQPGVVIFETVFSKKDYGQE